MKHLAIYLHNESNKQVLINNILFNRFLPEQYSFEQGGLLFSSSSIEQLIEEERKHDRFVVTTDNNCSVDSMSSGEQKKAVLQYFISRNPACIILDDWSSNLDTAGVKSLREILEKASLHIRVVQLFYRKNDLLPFIKEVAIPGNRDGYTIQPVSVFNDRQANTTSFNVGELPQFFQAGEFSCDPLVQLNRVSVSYNDRPVLKDIHWTIRPGEFWQLKGANGSGKTTLVSMIIGDNPKAFGQDMYLFGKKKGSGESVWDIKKNIGYFYPAMAVLFKRNDTVENMIISGFVDSIGLYKPPTELQHLAARAWLRLLGPQYEDKKFNDLSSGQQRIVLVIRAIVKMPPLLVLDEPATGLDDNNTGLFIQLINALAALKKIAIIYISHREEKGITPGKVIELLKTEEGSIARITS